MDLVLRSELRALWWRKAGLLSTLAIVVLGVASVVAVHRLSTAVDASLASQTPPWLRGDVALLSRADFTPQTYAELRVAWHRGELPGVAAVVPLLAGSLGSEVGAISVVGIDPFAGRYGLDDSAEASNDAPAPMLRMGGGVVLASADLPTELRLDTASGPLRVRTTTASGLPSATIVADIGDAERWLGDRASGFALARLDAPLGQWIEAAERLLPGISAALPDPAEGLRGRWPAGWSSTSGDTANALRQLGASIMFNLGALGTLAIVVAGFLLYQGAIVSRRRSELLRQRLFALGVPSARLRRIFLALGAAEGLLGGVLGTALGVLGADRLLLTQLDSAVPPLDWVLVAKGVGLGLGVAVAARWLASASGSALALPLATAVGLALSALVFVPGSGLLGAFGGLLGLCLLAAAIVPVGFALAARLRPTRLPLALHLGYAQLVRGRREMAASLTALALAVAASMSIAIMVESFRADLLRVLDLRLTAAAYLDVDTAPGAEPLSATEVRAELGDGYPTAYVTGFGAVDARIDATPVEVSYRRFDDRGAQRYGLDSPLLATETLISERLSRDLSVAVNDLLTISVGASRVALRVRGIFPGFGDVAPLALVDLAALPALNLEPRFDRFAIDGVPAEVVKQRLGRLGSVEAAADVRRLAEEQFDRTFAITDLLTFVALLVAGLGTVSALVALRLSQQREVDLLHALGTSRPTLTGAELMRGVTLGGFASALALPLGLAMAWVLCAVVNPRAFGWSVSWQPTPDVVVTPLALCLLMAIVAACLPMLLRSRTQARGDDE